MDDAGGDRRQETATALGGRRASRTTCDGDCDRVVRVGLGILVLRVGLEMSSQAGRAGMDGWTGRRSGYLDLGRQNSQYRCADRYTHAGRVSLMARWPRGWSYTLRRLAVGASGGIWCGSQRPRNRPRRQPDETPQELDRTGRREEGNSPRAAMDVVVPLWGHRAWLGVWNGRVEDLRR